MVQLEALNPGNWDNFRKHFLGSQWFERAWTFQEAVVARSVVGMFGAYIFTWELFMTFVNVITGGYYTAFASLRSIRTRAPCSAPITWWATSVQSDG